MDSEFTSSRRGSGPFAVVGPVPGAVVRRGLRLLSFWERCSLRSSALWLLSGIVILRCFVVDPPHCLRLLMMSVSRSFRFSEVAAIGQHNYQ